MESVPDDFAAVSHHNKCAGLLLPYKTFKPDGLFPLHHGKHNRFVIVAVRSFRLENSGTPVQLFLNKLTDRLRLRTNNCQIFAQVHILYDSVYHQRFCHQAAERKKSCLRAKYEPCRNVNQ